MMEIGQIDPKSEAKTDEPVSSLATYWYLCHSYKLENGLYRYKFSTKDFNQVWIDADTLKIAVKKLMVNLPDGAQYSGV